MKIPIAVFYCAVYPYPKKKSKNRPFLVDGKKLNPKI